VVSDLSRLGSGGAYKAVTGGVQRLVEVGVVEVGRQLVSDEAKHLQSTSLVRHHAALDGQTNKQTSKFPCHLRVAFGRVLFSLLLVCLFDSD